MPKRRTGDGRTFRRTRKLPDGTFEVSGPFWIEYYDVAGKQHRESTGLFEFKAADALRFERIKEKRSGVLVTPQTGRATVGELLDDLMREVRNAGQNEELASYHCNHLRKHFGAMTASKVGTDQIAAYMQARSAAGVCGGTINRELTRLRRAFQVAFDHEPPKVLRVPKIRKLAENPARTGFFEPQQYELVMRELPEELRPVLACGYRSGCRSGEVLSLRWSQIDLRTGIVRLRAQDTKTNEARLFPAEGELLDMLRILYEQRQQHWPLVDFVFTRAGKPIKDFRGAWKAATGRAGFPGLLFHDLRRTAVRNMDRSGISETVARRISGHKSRSVYERYNIVSERDMVDAGRRREAYLVAEHEAIKDKTRTMAAENKTAVQ